MGPEGSSDFLAPEPSTSSEESVQLVNLGDEKQQHQDNVVPITTAERPSSVAAADLEEAENGTADSAPTMKYAEEDSDSDAEEEHEKEDATYISPLYNENLIGRRAPPPQSPSKKLPSKRSSICLRKSASTVEMLQSLRQSSQDSGGNSSRRSLLEASIRTSFRNNNKPRQSRWRRYATLCCCCCFNPHFSLRTQLLLTFGTVNLITLLLVLLTCVLVSYSAGQHVKSINQDSFEQLFTGTEGTTARYLAESLTPRLIHADVADILVHAIQERFSGYPSEENSVPFVDVETGTNKYPLVGPPLPLAWQAAASGSSAFYHMQGACDPSVTDPDSDHYWPDCSDDHNNLSTGGVVAPSPTNEQIHTKSRDLVPMLKALHEFNQDELDSIGIFYANSGAGSTLMYPATQQLPTATGENASSSMGCEWVKMPNPLAESKSIGAQEDIERCRRGRSKEPADGLLISPATAHSSFNPLEHEWCRNQALEPAQFHISGPALSSQNDEVVLGGGRAVYDRMTNELIACMRIQSRAAAVQDVLHSAKVTSSSQVTVVRWNEEGTIVATTASSHSSNSLSLSAIHESETGVSLATYEQIFTLVNYGEIWDPAQVRQRYESFSTRIDGYLVSTYPIPPVPEDYDASYRPEFLVIAAAAFGASSDDLYDATVQGVNDQVNDNVVRAIYFALIVSAVGLVVATLIIYLMANTLTAPLSYMNAITNDLVGSLAASKNDKKKEDDDKIVKKTIDKFVGFCTPRTELDQVVEEFDKMISSFSGSSITKPVKIQLTEIPNEFQLQETFRDLYMSRKDADFIYSTKTIEASASGNEGLRFLHYNKNIRHSSGPDRHQVDLVQSSAHYDDKSITMRRCKSPLFFWTILLIVTPLFLTTIAVSVVVMYTVMNHFYGSVHASQEAFISIELNSMGVHAKLRADLVSRYLSRPALDLYITSRYASWLLFGGLDKSDAYPEMISRIEECKDYTNITECDFVREGFSCNCPWEAEATCPAEDPVQFRNGQRVAYVGQSQDTWPNGDRNSTTYPRVAYSQSSTTWYYDQRALPGSDAKSPADGYSTTYARFRAIAAVPVMPLLYNYDPVKATSAFVGFEADGSFIAYYICQTGNPRNGQWQSTEENGGNLIRPELCPLGKYGFDPRCREWWETPRQLYLANHSDTLHITPPYFYPSAADFVQSAITPIFVPGSEEFLGLAIVDFNAGLTVKALHRNRTVLGEGGFPVLITVKSGIEGEDAVIGPDFVVEHNAQPITELVLPSDQNCTSSDCFSRLARFDRIVKDMKAGGSSSGNRFERTMEDGTIQEVYFAYAPVFVKNLRPVDSSDFSSGAEQSDYLVYSLGLAEARDKLMKPFQVIEAELVREIWIAIGIILLVILLSMLSVSLISNVITVSITKTVHFLLELIQGINRLDSDDETPSVDRSTGCREIINVADAMEALHRLVRCANTTYGAGDLETAKSVLRDGLQLFRRLDNRKAIAIASNNLGNVMLALYRTLDATGDNSIFGMTREEIIQDGTAYYSEAIRLGEAAYEEFYEKTGWSPECLDFMQHLSDRYFNRAMFLLTVRVAHPNPNEAKDLGFRDLQIARDMDVEIIDEGEQGGWNRMNRATKLFNVALSRASGHITLQKMGYPDDWELDEVLGFAFALVNETGPSSDLFADVTPAGRLQQIETQLIKYYKLKGHVEVAAQIAIRLLVEDEYAFSTAQKEATEALVSYTEQELSQDPGQRTRIRVRLEAFLSELEFEIEEADRKRRATVHEMESTFISTLKGAPLSSSFTEPSSQHHHTSMRDSVRIDVTMERF